MQVEIIEQESSVPKIVSIIRFDPWPFEKSEIDLGKDVQCINHDGLGFKKVSDTWLASYVLSKDVWNILVILDNGVVAVAEERRLASYQEYSS